VKGDYDKARTIGFSANSLHSGFVPLHAVAQKLYKISLSSTQEEELEVFYRGWFNEFYHSAEEEQTDAQMVVERCGYDIEPLTVPDDTVAVYLGVDVQKDHFWCMIEAFREGGNSVIVFAERLESYGDVADLMGVELYYEDGELYMPGIRRTGIDLQGYVETDTIFDEKTGQNKTVIVKNVPEETRLFVLEQAELRGIDNDFERIYGIKGVDFLPDESMYRIATQQVKIEAWSQERDFKFIKMGSVAAKLSFMSRLNRTVFNHKGGKLQIAQPILDKYQGENDRFHLAHQITSEIYTWDPNAPKSTKRAKRKTFIKTKKQNHFLDCGAMIECLASIDRVDRLRSTKPKKDVRREGQLKQLFVIK